jgi:CheY-like chemotaxis protein
VVKKISLLWVDDEIDLLKPHVIFLESKGYLVDTATNGLDALNFVREKFFDLVLLDQNMPGLSGLETLNQLKKNDPSLPVIMITKSEEEDIMEEAIASKISNYLIKPLNPNQILLAIKKVTDEERLVSKKLTSDYQLEFGKIGLEINQANQYPHWVEIFKKLTYWDIEVEKLNDEGLKEVFQMQKTEANSEFAKFIKSHYLDWINASGQEKPLMSHFLFKERIKPLLTSGRKVVFILIDNLRYDQWKIILPDLLPYFNLEKEEVCCSILPTTTQFSRNAIFSGMMPKEIEKNYPHLWVSEEDEGGKNLHEDELLKLQLQRMGMSMPFFFEKVTTQKSGKKLTENISQLINHQLSVLIYNFVDMLSHARTEIELVKELAEDEAAYRSITLSWFRHSYILDLFRQLAEKNVTVVITADHGSIRVQNPIKVIGDRQITTNLRYKQGKNMDYNPKEVFEIKDPDKAFLPRANVSSTYIFATRDDFFAYPNNYNHYVKYYRNTLQHGGISMEEMLVPLAILVPKNL